MKSAKTPAPPKDRIKGSRINKKGSASTSDGDIVFSEKLTASIIKIIADSDVRLPTARAVVRRGFGAYSTSRFNSLNSNVSDCVITYFLFVLLFRSNPKIRLCRTFFDKCDLTIALINSCLLTPIS